MLQRQGVDQLKPASAHRLDRRTQAFPDGTVPRHAAESKTRTTTSVPCPRA
ncbi:hypothetical protein [Actinomadura sp. GC306]|uniref:hypothetical protein n=1 Tax=Actinomadura sp. GC306 TaxID=2530367 RepID=UPI001404F8DA|nr:hypothetical protein [Actinomadura sp. GC306]